MHTHCIIAILQIMYKIGQSSAVLPLCGESTYYHWITRFPCSLLFPVPSYLSIFCYHIETPLRPLWWCYHKMEMISALLVFCEVNSTVIQRGSTAELQNFFVVSLKKLLKNSRLAGDIGRHDTHANVMDKKCGRDTYLSPGWGVCACPPCLQPCQRKQWDGFRKMALKRWSNCSTQFTTAPSIQFPM